MKVNTLQRLDTTLMGTNDKLTRGHGLALHNPDSSGQNFTISSHFEPCLSDLPVLIFHFSSENKLTCQNHCMACCSIVFMGATLILGRFGRAVAVS